MPQQNTTVPGFPDVIGGRSRIAPVDHQGPGAGVYTAGGETFPQQGSLGGPNSIGMSSVLWCSGGYTEDGLYRVIPIYGGSAKVRGTIKLKWIVVSTGVELGNGVNVSGSVLRLLVIGG